jgi:hypothetical protein
VGASVGRYDDETLTVYGTPFESREEGLEQVFKKIRCAD